MGAQMATDPISLQQLRNASEDAQDLEHYVNDDAPALIQTRIGGQKPNYAKFLQDMRTEGQQAIDEIFSFIDRGPWEPSTDYSRKDLVTFDGIAYVTFEAHTSSSSFEDDLAAGLWNIFQGVNRSELSQGAGAGMVGLDPAQNYEIGTAGYALEALPHLFDKPAIQSTQFNPAITYSDNDYTNYVDSFGDSLYRHSPRIVRDAAGQYHMVYSRGKMHGYGGLSEENAIDPEGSIVYVSSWDLINWSAEQIICQALPPDPGLNPFRTVFDCYIGVTPSGRMAVVVSDIPPPSAVAPGGWGRYTGNTKYRLFTNDERGGAASWVDRGVFFEHNQDYARIYSNGIKCIPKLGGGWRMAFSDYRLVTGTLVTVGMFYSDDEFQTLPVRGADMLTATGNTETDFTFLDARLGIAVTRGNFATSITTNGGQSWTLIGTAANFDRTITPNEGFVSPTITTIRVDGNPMLLVGWAERNVSPRSIRWVTASVRELLAFQTAVSASQLYTPWTIVSQSGPAFVGSGGYQSPIVFEDGSCFYVDVTETSADPVTSLMRAQLRLVRFGVKNLAPRQYGLMLGSKRSWLRQHNEDENTYTPALVGSSTTGSGTVSVVGTNTRTGNRCKFNGTLTVTGQSGFAGSIRITGLPYRSMDGLSQLVNVEVTSALAAGWNAADRVVGLVISDTNYIALYKKVAATQALVGLLATDIGANFSCHIFGDYKCRFPGNQ